MIPLAYAVQPNGQTAAVPALVMKAEASTPFSIRLVLGDLENCGAMPYSFLQTKIDVVGDVKPFDIHEHLDSMSDDEYAALLEFAENSNAIPTIETRRVPPIQ